jgi:hypothetical protein|nr:MAG TPA: hypothetical protein [Caudoviricetes sp.]
MEFTDLITELKNPTMISNIIIIGLCVFTGLMVLAIIFEMLKLSLASGTFTVLAIITMIGLIITCIATAGQKTKLDYELSRDKNYVYIDSHNNNLKSAKLKIIGQDKQVIYVLYKDETYKIPVMIDKR